MGGRGSKSKSTPPTNPMWQSATYMARQAVRQAQQQNPQQQPTNLQTGNATQTAAQATATLATIMNMTDDQLAAAIKASKNVSMPNFLNDRPDVTQQFVYQVGLNGLPQVLDSTQFQQYMQANGIPRSQILSRSVRPTTTNYGLPITVQQIFNTFKYSSLNYIGGKVGGMVYGAGTYFDMNGGGNTSYGTGTMHAILNPATARVISDTALYNKYRSFAASHPKTVAALGPITNKNQSIYALAMGYNVISAGTYHNVIDRSAVIVED